MRTPAVANKPRTSRLKSFAAPNGGWIANRNLAQPEVAGMAPGAEVLENFFPTASSAIMRRGSERYATLGEGVADVVSLFSYKNGAQEQLFGATDDTIYDITTNNLDVLTGQTSGDWSVVQFATSGGVFLRGVNGEDPSFIYDGTRFYPSGAEDVYTLAYDGGTAFFTVGETLTGGTSAATAIIAAIDGDEVSGTLILHTITGGPFVNDEAITDSAGGAAVADGAEALAYSGVTGVDTADLNYVWVYKNRLWFVEKESLSAWYLSVDAITGTATEFPLGGVFTLGGRLLFGASWSLGEGASGGLSAQCIFVSTEGEVAVYQGSDPSDAANWSLVGVYRIGKPLGKQAFIRAGGDLVIATDIGFVPLSQAIQRDYAALSPSAVSFPIEDAWREAVELRSGSDWRCTVWPTKQMVVVALPTVNERPEQWFVANTRTGAWGSFTGWDAKCLEVFRGRLFYGSTDGKVVEANVTGMDEGSPYTASYVPLFNDFRSPGSLKIAKLARAVLRSPYELAESVGMQSDFVVNLPTVPDATPVTTSTWGDAVWGESVWGAQDVQKVAQDWQSVGGTGYALAPSLQITSGANTPLDAEIVRMDVTYSMGDLLS